MKNLYTYYPVVGVLMKGLMANPLPSHIVFRSDEYYVLVLPETIRGVKSRLDQTLNAYEQLVYERGAKCVWYDRVSETSLISLPKEFASVQLWRKDGTIHHLVRWGTEIIRQPLSEYEVVARRVKQLRDQMLHNVDMKRRHGILNGAFRLLKAAEDSDAQDQLVDFLLEHHRDLPEMLRRDIYAKLQWMNHEEASKFSEGGAVILLFQKTKPSGPPASRKAFLAKRAVTHAANANKAASSSRPAKQAGKSKKK